MDIAPAPLFKVDHTIIVITCLDHASHVDDPGFPASRYVDDSRKTTLRLRRQEVDCRDIGDVNEIAGLLSITENRQRFAAPAAVVEDREGA